MGVFRLRTTIRAQRRSFVGFRVASPVATFLDCRLHGSYF
jgi:hypothetical protein